MGPQSQAVEHAEQFNRPVFPWLLANYDSPELDLSQPATLRDLPKPRRASASSSSANATRNETGGPYHYGTHFSSAMIVCSFSWSVSSPSPSSSS